MAQLFATFPSQLPPLARASRRSSALPESLSTFHRFAERFTLVLNLKLIVFSPVFGLFTHLEPMVRKTCARGGRDSKQVEDEFMMKNECISGVSFGLITSYNREQWLDCGLNRLCEPLAKSARKASESPVRARNTCERTANREAGKAGLAAVPKRAARNKASNWSRLGEKETL